MIQILNSSLSFGSSESYCSLGNKADYTVVHFCKSFFEKHANSNKILSIQKNIYEYKCELYVNIIDESDPSYFKLEIFKDVITWLNAREKVFIHCDYGQSRSPSLCMLYGSKVLKVLPKDFLDCIRVMKSIQPDFVTPSGITKFLKKNWNNFDQLTKTIHN